MEGVDQALKENPDVTLIQTIGDIDTPEKAPNAVATLLAARRGEINGILATAYNPAVAVANELRKLDEKNIKAVGIDTDQIVLDAIKDGYLTGTMAQNPYGMAYLPLESLNLMARATPGKEANHSSRIPAHSMSMPPALATGTAAAKALNDKLKAELE